MEQVEGGDLVVNRGDESRLKDAAAEKRDMNSVEGLEAAVKLAQVRRVIPSKPRITSPRTDTYPLFLPPGRTRPAKQEERSNTPEHNQRGPKSHHILLCPPPHPAIHNHHSPPRHHIRLWRSPPTSRTVHTPIPHLLLRPVACDYALDCDAVCTWEVAGAMG